MIEQGLNAFEQSVPLAGWELPCVFQTLRRLMKARLPRTGRREYVQILRLLETFEFEDLHAAVKTALPDCPEFCAPAW